MITVKAFKYDSPNHYINKQLIDVATFTGNLKDETSVIDPVFEVESPLDLSQTNYIWISELHRYYYVLNIVSVATGLWRFHCHVDVLMTYKPVILGHEAVIARQQSLYNLYLNDGDTFKVTQRSKIQQKQFPNGFTGSSYVMIVAGGPGNVPTVSANELVDTERVIEEKVEEMEIEK